MSIFTTLYLDRTGQCQDVQRYNTGLTWMSANSKCRKTDLNIMQLFLLNYNHYIINNFE